MPAKKKNDSEAEAKPAKPPKAKSSGEQLPAAKRAKSTPAASPAGPVAASTKPAPPTKRTPAAKTAKPGQTPEAKSDKPPKKSEPLTNPESPKTTKKSAAKSSSESKAPAPTLISKPTLPDDEELPKSKLSSLKALIKPIKKSIQKKSAAEVAPPQQKKTKGEMLQKILMMRAQQTQEKSQEIVRSIEAGEDEIRYPQSVVKAAARVGILKTPTPPAPANSSSAQALSEAEKNKKKRKRKAPYSKTEIKELRGILEAERKRLVKDLDLINDVAHSTEESMSRTFSSHQADAAQDSSSLETTFVTRRYGEERLHQIVVALERIEEGSYGLCELCTDEKQELCESCPFIPISRLRAKPFAKMCVQLRTQIEKRNKQK
ncbi:MAG: hypothetical protein SFY68_10080 [Candidatus Sumerlaeia bacterium]|nr:hypothetical protein [Candidatus Sumerlaeia bacterium]